MNNNGLSLLRHLHDLGYDSKLFLYRNDGHGDSSHFSWENDTWNSKKWSSRVVRTELVNGHLQSLNFNFIFHTLINFTYKVFKYFKLPGRNFLQVGVYRPGQYIDSIFSEFNIIIASGIAPALFTLSHKEIDIFYPYSTGIEFYKAPSSTKNLYSSKVFSLLIKFIVNHVKKKQALGITQVKQVYNAELSITKNYLEKIGKPYKVLPIPLVYNENFPKQSPRRIEKILRLIKKDNFNIIMTSRQFWVPPKRGSYEWEKVQSKRNYILYDAFEELKRLLPTHKLKLFILEYGKDVVQTKIYLKNKNLEDDVVWIPKLSRKELMLVLSKMDVSVGEFYLKKGTIWGGTAMEALSLGKPFLNSFNFEEKNFENLFNMKKPPILNSNNSKDVFKHLYNLVISKEYYDLISKNSLQWYSDYSGKSLAKKWIKNLVN